MIRYSSYINPSYLHFVLVFIPYSCIIFALCLYLIAKSPSTSLVSSDGTVMRFRRAWIDRLTMPVICSPVLFMGFWLLTKEDGGGLVAIFLATILSLYFVGPHDILIDGGKRVCTFRCGWPWTCTRTCTFDDLAGIWIGERAIGLKFKYADGGLQMDSLKSKTEASAMAERVSETTCLPIINWQRYRSRSV